VTAHGALTVASAAAPGERLRRYEAVCAPRGSCQHNACERDSGRWSFCPECLTVFDDYGKAVNEITESVIAQKVACRTFTNRRRQSLQTVLHSHVARRSVHKRRHDFCLVMNGWRAGHDSALTRSMRA
jgi:hypothetical protein